VADDIPATGLCNNCSRVAPLRSVLEGVFDKEPFRVGYYLCRWHQGRETRWRRQRDRQEADRAR
jgi:hypothetical protein